MLDPNAVPGADVDLRGTLWYYWWLKDALLTGGSTEVTDLFCYPYGVDIHAQTGGNFVDAVLDPFSGPSVLRLLRRVCCSAICRKHCGDASPPQDHREPRSTHVRDAFRRIRSCSTTIWG